MFRTNKRAISFALTYVPAILAACGSQSGREDRSAVSSGLTNGPVGSDTDGDKVTLCHMPPGNPANLRLLTVGSAAAPAFEAQGDGVCSGGATDCCLESGPASLCTDLNRDPANCGACGNACPGPTSGSGAPVCNGGICGVTCFGFTPTLCGNACVDTESNVADCGACGNVCGAGQSCCDGQCFDLTSSDANCGACGATCVPTQTCAGGVCQCPAGESGCSACNLPVVAASPFPPLYGTAQLSGTFGVPSTNMPLGNPECTASLVTTPTSGLLTFTLSSISCSFAFAGTVGSTYSNVDRDFGGMSLSFDGDTYRCTYQFNGNSASPYNVCPELSNHTDGLNASLSLSVTRSTGAVTLSRDCHWSDAACDSAYFVRGPASVLDLSGSLICNDATANAPFACGSTSCSAPSQACCTYPFFPPVPGFQPPVTGCVPGGSTCAVSGIFGQYSSCTRSGGCPSGFVCCQPPDRDETGPTCQATACAQSIGSQPGWPPL